MVKSLEKSVLQWEPLGACLIRKSLIISYQNLHEQQGSGVRQKNETILWLVMSNIKVEISFKFLTVRVIKKEHLTVHYEWLVVAMCFVRRRFQLKTLL